jgi:HD-GYP domain-containing protein (c-di-GMP phosphodiesterase class II)
MAMTDLSEILADAEILCRSLLDELGRKDPRMRESAKRVAYCSVALAQAMGIPEDEMETIGEGALLHEIGKLAISDAILRKPAALTAEERGVMREYCRLGYEMVSRIPSLAPAAEIVYSHRENFDGSGYPQGLKGEAIPLGARVVAIADAFEMFIGDRPHWWERALVNARCDVRHWAGRSFDPDIVRVLESIPSDRWEGLRESGVAS